MDCVGLYAAKMFAHPFIKELLACKTSMQATILFTMVARKSKELDELERRGTFSVLRSITTEIEVQRT